MALLATHKDKEFHIGDIVRVHQKIQEDNKTRTQVFEGTVMAIQGQGMGKSFIVRRIGAANVAIERIFPLSSPLVEKVEVKTPGHVKRSKIYFIREKSARELAEITRPRTVRSASQKSASPKPSKKAKKGKKK
jgi:large subunit ribosomal protein L19